MEDMAPLTEAVFYILLAVHRPNHGYGIIQKVDEITEHHVVLGPGTLYGAINSLLKKGWIVLYSEDTASRKKKQYVITEKGTEALAHELMRLQKMIEIAQQEQNS